MNPKTRSPAGQVFKELVLDAHGVSVKEAAESLGISEYTLRKVIKGEKPMTVDIAKRIEASFDKPARLLMRIEGMYQEWLVTQTKTPDVDYRYSYG